MIKSLRTEDLGLSPEMSVKWASRMNLITGDNGLGKSFLLDLAWWVLTRTWAGLPVTPVAGHPLGKVDFVMLKHIGRVRHTSRIALNGEEYETDDLRPITDAVVVYARVDGGISVWDPYRNGEMRYKSLPPAFNFNGNEVWDGLRYGETDVCEGLERDWVSWQKGSEPQFNALKKALATLSPTDEPIVPGKPQRVFPGEGRDRPTIVFGGQTVPLVHASSGIRRILSLAYVMVWAWFEHQTAKAMWGHGTGSEMVVLLDEVETHLHPRWQRTILPSLMRAANGLRGPEQATPQMIVTTHAPLVLASVEPDFDRQLDDLIHLDLRDGQLVLEQGAWSKQGDAVNWLVSKTFGLEQARNKPAEDAIEAAEAFMRGSFGELTTGLATKEEIDTALRRLLPDNDPFWARWIVHTENLDD